jgi:hypothetical protein
VDGRFFEAAKYEVARDITSNPKLREIVEQTAFGTSGLGL